MAEDINRQLEKKAYEIVYSIFRISGNLGRQPFSYQLENHGLAHFDGLISGNYPYAVQEGRILEYYLRLGGDLGLIHQDNIEMLISEIGNANSAIADVSGKATSTGPEYIKLPLSKNGIKATRKTEAVPANEPAEAINKELEAIANQEELSVAEVIQARQEPSQSEIRQSAITEVIRQSGNCRMKDIIEAFPSVSERTLRYDIEKLLERGTIERMGPGGPATSYRVKGSTLGGEVMTA